jgi:hypothetical protein
MALRFRRRTETKTAGIAGGDSPVIVRFLRRNPVEMAGAAEAAVRAAGPEGVYGPVREDWDSAASFLAIGPAIS